MEKVQNIQRYQFDKNRAEMARVQFILNRCQDIPLPYQMLIPPSFYAAELLEAETLARTMFERDAKEYAENPWLTVASERSDLIDWTGVSYVDRCKGALKLCGVPNAIRRGFENHPAVLEAIEISTHTAEYFKTSAVRRMRDKCQAAERAVQAAIDASSPAAEVSALRAEAVEFRAGLKRVEDTTLDDLRKMGPGFDPTSKK